MGGLCFSPHRVVGELGVQSDTSDKEPTCQRRRHKRLGFDPWVWTMPWRRKGQTPHSSFLAQRIPWTEEPGGLQTMCPKELNMNDHTGTHMALALGTDSPRLGSGAQFRQASTRCFNGASAGPCPDFAGAGQWLFPCLLFPSWT